MSNKVSIVMYHFVRELEHSRYPRIKGLDTSLFKAQLDFLDRHYRFVSMDQVMDAVNGVDSLPEKAVLLTFDDAYIDHFLQVFPTLVERGIPAAFYAPVRAITEHRVLDVNKIHFILAATESVDRLLNRVREKMAQNREEFRLHSDDWYVNRLAKPGRYDGAEVVFIKRLLQRELPEALRFRMVDELFAEFVQVDEGAFSRELYMNEDQLRCMLRMGMHIGNHGYDHYWLDHLDIDSQRRDISKGLEFLRQLGVPPDRWTMCYPYGAHNADTRDILSGFNCQLALTTEVDVAKVDVDSRFTMPRLNTNDLPKDAGADVNSWYSLG